MSTEASPRLALEVTLLMVLESPCVPWRMRVFAPSLNDCWSPCRSDETPEPNARKPVPVRARQPFRARRRACGQTHVCMHLLLQVCARGLK